LRTSEQTRITPYANAYYRLLVVEKQDDAKAPAHNLRVLVGQNE